MTIRARSGPLPSPRLPAGASVCDKATARTTSSGTSFRTEAAGVPRANSDNKMAGPTDTKIKMKQDEEREDDATHLQTGPAAVFKTTSPLDWGAGKRAVGAAAAAAKVEGSTKYGEYDNVKRDKGEAKKASVGGSGTEGFKYDEFGKGDEYGKFDEFAKYGKYNEADIKTGYTSGSNSIFTVKAGPAWMSTTSQAAPGDGSTATTPKQQQQQRAAPAPATVTWPAAAVGSVGCSGDGGQDALALASGTKCVARGGPGIGGALIFEADGATALSSPRLFGPDRRPFSAASTHAPAAACDLCCPMDIDGSPVTTAPVSSPAFRGEPASTFFANVRGVAVPISSHRTRAVPLAGAGLGPRLPPAAQAPASGGAVILGSAPGSCTNQTKGADGFTSTGKGCSHRGEAASRRVGAGSSRARKPAPSAKAVIDHDFKNRGKRNAYNEIREHVGAGAAAAAAVGMRRRTRRRAFPPARNSSTSSSITPAARAASPLGGNILTLTLAELRASVQLVKGGAASAAPALEELASRLAALPDDDSDRDEMAGVLLRAYVKHGLWALARSSAAAVRCPAAAKALPQSAPPASSPIVNNSSSRAPAHGKRGFEAMRKEGGSGGDAAPSNHTQHKRPRLDLTVPCVSRRRVEHIDVLGRP